MARAVQADHSDDPIQGPEHPKTFGDRVWGFLKELVIIVVGAIIVSALLRNFVGQPFFVPSHSMDDTLQPGDKVVVQKITHFQRGNVVVFRDPGGWLGNDSGLSRPGPAEQAMQFLGLMPSPDDHLIKRVIGLPGDHVRCCDSRGRVSVNDVALDETYVYPGDVPSMFGFDVVVPADRIFVMGDHRSDSADSRCHLADAYPGRRGDNAFVPVENVVGVAQWIVFPVDRWRTLEVPATFGSVPAPAVPAGEGGVKRLEGKCGGG